MFSKTPGTLLRVFACYLLRVLISYRATRTCQEYAESVCVLAKRHLCTSIGWCSSKASRTLLPRMPCYSYTWCTQSRGSTNITGSKSKRRARRCFHSGLACRRPVVSPPSPVFGALRISPFSSFEYPLTPVVKTNMPRVDTLQKKLYSAHRIHLYTRARGPPPTVPDTHLLFPSPRQLYPKTDTIKLKKTKHCCDDVYHLEPKCNKA